MMQKKVKDGNCVICFLIYSLVTLGANAVFINNIHHICIIFIHHCITFAPTKFDVNPIFCTLKKRTQNTVIIFFNRLDFNNKHTEIYLGKLSLISLFDCGQYL